MGTTAYVGIGANLGDALESVKAALTALSKLPGTQLRRSSSLYVSAPVDADGNDFINAAARLDTDLDPLSLLVELQKIERLFGRERPFRHAPRTLDLDLLLYDDLQMHDAVLEIPHPRMSQRAFVLLPLLELDPEIRIPGKGCARDYVAAVMDQKIRMLSEHH